MRCTSCESKKTPSDCLISAEDIMKEYGLPDLGLDHYQKFIHRRAEEQCLADCFNMDARWCNTFLPGHEPDFDWVEKTELKECACLESKVKKFNFEPVDKTHS